MAEQENSPEEADEQKKEAEQQKENERNDEPPDAKDLTVGSEPKNQAEILLSKPILIPRNPLALVTRLVMVIFLIDIGFGLILAILMALSIKGIFFLVVIFLLIKMFAAIGMILLLSKEWAEKSFSLTERQLMVSHGTASHEQETYELEHIRKVHLVQDPVGRLFDFGHIDLLLVSMNFKQEVRLTDLKDPSHYLEVFQKYLG